jgi:alanine racemase
MTRPARALIDLSALRHNFQQVRERAPGCRVLAVVKADAYGHGAGRVAMALEGADGFAVARVQEARELRALGIDRPVVLLSGVSSDGELADAAELRLDLVVHHDTQTAALERATLREPVRVWIKVDTGMHRLGLAPEQVPDTWRRLEACPSVADPLRLMSHLARADERGDPSTAEQITRFRSLGQAAGTETSLANSAGVLAWPAAHGDWVRPGIMLYGISPFVGGRGEADGLRPVMTFESRLVAVNRLSKGDPIGYGGTWICPEDMPVGVAAIGYGDGYPRHAPAGTPVLVNGTRVALIGRVSMDLVTLDLRPQPAAVPGDPVVLWGRGLPAEEIAEHVGSIGYELVTRVAPRVARVTRETVEIGEAQSPSASAGESR